MFGVCCYVEEMLHRPPVLARDMWVPCKHMPPLTLLLGIAVWVPLHATTRINADLMPGILLRYLTGMRGLPMLLLGIFIMFARLLYTLLCFVVQEPFQSSYSW